MNPDLVIRRHTPEGKYLNEYLKIKKLAEGPQAKLTLVKSSKDGKHYVIKKFNMFLLRKKKIALRNENGKVKYDSPAEKVEREMQIHICLKHPHVAAVKEVITDKENQKVYMVLQYCQFGDLATWDAKTEAFTCNPKIKTIAQLVKCLHGAAEGLAYLHGNNVIHRDIKPMNILLGNGCSAQIIDFGSAVKVAENEKLKGSEGTYHFMAPEMLSQMYPEGYDGKKTDIWSLGVSFYAILTGKLPFFCQPVMKLFQSIMKGQYKWPPLSESQLALVPLIAKMLAVDPVARPSAVQVMLMLANLI